MYPLVVARKGNLVFNYRQQYAGFRKQAAFTSHARLLISCNFSFRGEKLMKKLATLAFALLLAGSLSFAQAAGSTSSQAPADAGKTTDTSKKAHKSKKGHKSGKKAKKGASDAAPAPAPK
jgi:hypothetical protein